MKKCNKCLNTLELDQFHKKAASKDGYNNVCKSCKTKLNDEFYQKNRDSKIEYQKEYRELNKEKVDAYKKEYNLTYSKIYYENNKTNKLIYNNNYHRERAKRDPEFKLRKLLRIRFHHALKNGHKIESIIKLMGCSVEECRSYLETQFKPEMTWENHGAIWEIDHIKPCASFNLMLLEEQEKCFHYTNIQPLFKTTEIAKSLGYNDIIGNRDKGDN